MLFKKNLFCGKTSEEVLECNKKCKMDFSEKEDLNIPKLAMDLLLKMLEPD